MQIQNKSSPSEVSKSWKSDEKDVREQISAAASSWVLKNDSQLSSVQDNNRSQQLKFCASAAREKVGQLAQLAWEGWQEARPTCWVLGRRQESSRSLLATWRLVNLVAMISIICYLSYSYLLDAMPRLTLVRHSDACQRGGPFLIFFPRFLPAVATWQMDGKSAGKVIHRKAPEVKT